MKLRDHINLCEQTTWSGSSTSHHRQTEEKSFRDFRMGWGRWGQRTPRPRISFLLLYPRQAFHFIPKSHKPDRHRESIYLQPWAPRTLPWTWGASRAVEASAAGRRALLVPPEHRSLPTAGLQEGEREAGLQRQLRALSRLKPEGRLRSQWRVLGNHKAGRNYSERKISEDEQGQSTSCKQVLSKVPFQVGSSEFRTFFSPVQMKASTNGHQ